LHAAPSWKGHLLGDAVRATTPVGNGQAWYTDNPAVRISGADALEGFVIGRDPGKWDHDALIAEIEVEVRQHHFVPSTRP
jgi:hypothetical protein